MNLVEHCKRTDYELYEHLYLGKPLAEVKGGVFEQELKKATANGQFRSVPYNPKYPVDTAWDLGHGDATAIWFFQAYDGFYNFIDYLEGRGRTIESYIIDLNHKPYMYRTDWLPHDGVDAIIHKKLTADPSSWPAPTDRGKAPRKHANQRRANDLPAVPLR